MNGYGKELILDIHDCDISTFNRKSIENFCVELCELIDMEACDIHFWDDEGVPIEEQQTEPHTKGTSVTHTSGKQVNATQFILTSNITIHCLELLKKTFFNLFSCKDFNSDVVAKFTREWFRGIVVNRVEVSRL